MRINIDHDIYMTHSPNNINEMIDNVKQIFTAIHTMKGWRWPLSNLRVSLDLHESHQGTGNTPTIWVNLNWAARTGASTSPEELRTIFVSKATKNRDPQDQNVYTYHSYNDLVSHFERNKLHEIIV